MTNPPRYRFILSPEGIVRMTATDGEPITEETVDWLRGVVRDALRVKALTQSPTHQRSLELQEQQPSGMTRGGVRFDIDPIILELDAEREKQGISRAGLSKAMMLQATRLTDYVRGQSRPQLETVRLWARMIGWYFIIVPAEIMPEVQSLVKKWRERRDAEQQANEIEVA